MGDQISINLSHILLGRPSKFFLLNFFLLMSSTSMSPTPSSPFVSSIFFLIFWNKKQSISSFYYGHLNTSLKICPLEKVSLKGFNRSLLLVAFNFKQIDVISCWALNQNRLIINIALTPKTLAQLNSSASVLIVFQSEFFLNAIDI